MESNRLYDFHIIRVRDCLLCHAQTRLLAGMQWVYKDLCLHILFSQFIWKVQSWDHYLIPVIYTGNVLSLIHIQMCIRDSSTRVSASRAGACLCQGHTSVPSSQQCLCLVFECSLRPHIVEHYYETPSGYIQRRQLPLRSQL